jgi:S-formylglutathione hydrolase FrmB
MGGYGSLKFGLKSPSTFVFAASMSGALGVRRFTEKETCGERFGPHRYNSLDRVDSETRKANESVSDN